MNSEDLQSTRRSANLKEKYDNKSKGIMGRQV